MSLNLPKVLCIAGIAVAVLVFLLFFADLAIGYINPGLAPFKHASQTLDATFIICAAGLGALSWFTLKEQE
ncbi:MAG: hypothetical protein CMJ59_22485 [Planctomycetaceae bacterium]|nr:hypothetical protein [Planctomycetaceae bacterium]